ncbi:unnamed protein product, partial [Urochloa humidicola]
VEDNEPASRWLALIHQALNEPQEQPDEDDDPPPPEPPPDAGRRHHLHHHRRRDSSLFFQTPSLKVLSNSYRVDSALVKTCNCSAEPSSMRRRAADVRAAVYRAEAAAESADAPPSTRAASASTAAESTSATGDAEADGGADGTPPAAAHSDPGGGGMSYCLIASKQMVGLFLSVWVKRELVEHVGHLRVDCVGRGIMGWLGNKGCIAISMTLHRSSLCFVCSHLASGEKEGDELRRNADVAEILRCAHFPRTCRAPGSHRVPEKIMDHDRMIWLGDLNYRVSLSYEETRTLLEENDWDTLLEKDQGECSGGGRKGRSASRRRTSTRRTPTPTPARRPSRRRSGGRRHGATGYCGTARASSSCSTSAASRGSPTTGRCAACSPSRWTSTTGARS